MNKSERRELQRRKARYGPKLTNPGLRIIARDLAVKAQVTDEVDRDYVAGRKAMLAQAGVKTLMVPCPVCTPIVNPRCRDCDGTKLVSVEDARLINVALRRS